MNSTPYTPIFQRSASFKVCKESTFSAEAMACLIQGALALLDPAKPISFITSNQVNTDPDSPDYNPDGLIMTFTFRER